MTATEGLQLALQNLGSAIAAYSFETESGVTTYYADLTTGEIAIECDDESLTAGAKEQIRDNTELLFKGKTDADSLAMKVKVETGTKTEGQME